MDDVPKIFNNCVNSIIFTNIQCMKTDLNNSYELIELYDLIDKNLNVLLTTDKCQIHCRKIPDYHILKVIDWCIHFNTNDYKCNTIMRKLVYILYYYIQDRKNVINLYQLHYGNTSGIHHIRQLLPNIQSINPTIKKLLTMGVEEIDDYVAESRLYVLNILNKELIFLPADLVNIICGYIPDLQILEIAEMF